MTPLAGEIDSWTWSAPASAPTGPGWSFAALSAPFRQAIEAQIGKLKAGLERSLAWLLVERKLAAEAGPEIPLELEAWRRVLRVRPERFADLWQRVRAILPLVFVGGRVEWADVDKGRHWVEHLRMQQSAKGVIGNAVKRLHRVVERAAPSEEWLAAFEAAMRKLRFAQERAREAGMKVANELADRSLALAAEKLAGKGGWRQAFKRLDTVAAVLGISAERVEQVWSDLKTRRDLVMRHGYGCLHFNALRQALLGTLNVWEWPELLDDPGRLRERCGGGADPPGPAAA